MRRIALLTTIILASCHPAYAQEAKAQLYNKPVLCAGSEQKAIEMLKTIRGDGMKPLMFWRGNSFNGDSTRFNSNFFILYDHVDNQITVVEQQDTGFTCVISGGTGNITFQPEEIQSKLRFWDSQ